MKRKVLCVFSLVAYLLLFCTIFAPMAGREMAILVDIKQIKKNVNFNPQVAVSCALWDDEEIIFQVVEGTGWNTGSRADPLPRQYYSISHDFKGNPSHVVLSPGADYTVILSASRTPRKDDLVEIVDAEESPGEKLILYCPEGVQEIKLLQNNFTVSQQGDQGILMDTIGIKMPYFEHRTIQALKNRIITETLRIYSYTDAKNFLWQLPLLSLIAGLLLCGVILWGGTCLLTKKQQSGRLLWVNTGTISLTLLLIWPLTYAVDLPASLMPPNSILDLGHYFSEFSNIFAALASVGDTSLHTLSILMTIASVAILMVITELSIMFLKFQYKRNKTK